MLEVTGLCKAYPSFRLDHVSLTLREGAVTGFIGRNGAGKSTTLKCLMGFVRPDEGQVRFFGGQYGDMRENYQAIGYVAGSFDFYPNKRLEAITAVTAPFYRQWDEDVYRRCMERFRLDGRKTVAQLSQGMKVKYALTLALSHHARLLILDEPTSGLDPVSRDELLDELLRLNREGTTILYSTHITTDLTRCADDILYIREGRLQAQGDMRAFLAGYRAVSMTDDEHARAEKTRLIGCRRGKDGWEALIRREDEGRVPGTVAPADLDTVMIHLEKEAAL